MPVSSHAVPRGSTVTFELASTQVLGVDCGDLQFAPVARGQTTGDVDHGVVVEVEPRNGIRGARMCWLLLDGDHRAVVGELHDAIRLRVWPRGR